MIYSSIREVTVMKLLTGGFHLGTTCREFVIYTLDLESASMAKMILLKAPDQTHENQR